MPANKFRKMMTEERINKNRRCMDFMSRMELRDELSEALEEIEWLRGCLYRHANGGGSFIMVVKDKTVNGE